ncbi:hypothetical protein M0R45_006617 [Rubus argutus]|uniref:Uncharacterized protein n=1 Tax=Rubus argutus TaxID=59490 RepID=A0AAW1YR99_RUBAR
MVRERKDFYQLKKAAGEDPAPEVAIADATDVVAAAPIAASGAAVDSAPKRKKKKAKRARSASEVEVDMEEDAGVQEDASVPAEAAAATPTRTAREERRQLACGADLDWTRRRGDTARQRQTTIAAPAVAGQGIDAGSSSTVMGRGAWPMAGEVMEIDGVEVMILVWVQGNVDGVGGGRG